MEFFGFPGGKCGFSAMNHQEEWRFHGKRLD
jgi:hypothetical protein